VAAGTADQAVPFDGSKAVAILSSRSVFVPIVGAGHALLIEASDRVMRVILDFLEAG
jgi:pimeloyl-ACP methyl ester carboxylesterase